MSADDQPDLDPVHADAIRRAYVRPIDEDTARRQLSAIVAAAAAGEQPVTPRPRERRRVWRAALAAGAATLLSPVGLAVAGVSLPKALERPYRVVGIMLPNQANHAPPAARPLPRRSPTTTPATAEPRGPHDQRADDPRGGRGDPQRGKRQGEPGNATGAQHKSRAPGAGLPHPPNGAARNKHTPTPSNGRPRSDRTRSRPRAQGGRSSQRPSTPAVQRKTRRLPGDR